MVVYAREFQVPTGGELDFVDISEPVQRVVAEARVRTGTATVFLPGATGAILLNENEPGAIEDYKAAIRRLAPDKGPYHHPDNARSHVRALMLGPSCTVPVREGRVELGTWQSIFLVELDVRPRDRRVSVTVVGSSAVHEEM